jgi:hypothetical protein
MQGSGIKRVVNDGPKGNKPGPHHKNGKKGGSRARKLVNIDIRNLARDTKSDVRKERRQFRRERGDIRHTYKQSGAYLHKLKRDTRDTYNNTIDTAKTAQQHLQDLLAQQSGALQGDAGGELSRLGLGGSDALGQMGADSANAQMVAQQNGADNLANLRMSRANANGMSDMFIASNKGSKMSDLGQARNIRDENISSLRDALHQAQAGRGDAIRSMLIQLAGQRKYGSYSPYQSSYNPSYGYGYSSSTGSNGYTGGGGTSGGGNGYSANAAKQRLYSQLLNLQP